MSQPPPQTQQDQPGPSTRVDLVSFIFGMIMVAVAGVTLWMTFIGAVRLEWLKVAAPLFLVLVGVLGLTLSRTRR